MKKSVIEIEKQMQLLTEKLAKIRKYCKHVNKQKHFRQNDSDDIRLEDSYWTDFNCLDCGKRWKEKGSK